MPAQTVRDFAAAINLHDTEKIASLMTEDHEFIDAHNTSIRGCHQMKAGWAGYFEWFPDYHIELTELFTHHDTVAAFGFASGTYKGLKTAANEFYWRLPAAWKAVVQDGKIRVWQVFADTKIPFDIMTKHNIAGEEKTANEGRVTAD